MAYDIEYIKARIAVNESGCWIWQLSLDRYGYGLVSPRCGEGLAHRLSYRVFKGRPDKHVLHICDVPACVNPDHLYLGTQADNMRDAVERGHHYAPTSKLSEEEWKQVTLALRGGCKQKDIAEYFGISQSRLSTIKHKLLQETSNG